MREAFDLEIFFQLFVFVRLAAVALCVRPSLPVETELFHRLLAWSQQWCYSWAPHSVDTAKKFEEILDPLLR